MVPSNNNISSTDVVFMFLLQCLDIATEAAIGGVQWKKVFLKVYQNW